MSTELGPETAREHYEAATRWLDTASTAFTVDEDNREFGWFALGNAHVHALMAQAATADPTLVSGDAATWSPDLFDATEATR